MTLYLYKTGTNVPVLTIENVTAYTDNWVKTEEGGVYGPFAEDVELSSRPDCFETLRADWRRENPENGDRLGALEKEITAIAAAIERGLSL